MPCPSCGRGFHNECIDCEICHGDIDRAMETFVSINKGGNPRGGAGIKDASDVTDPKSTGRKRAAQLYPIFDNAPCEWRGNKNCGGGRFPIIGCISGIQKHRHHGPVKNPLHNEPGNVHRICHHCHNRWHTLNDNSYDELEYKSLPHAPEVASELDLLTNEAQWKLKKVQVHLHDE